MRHAFHHVDVFTDTPFEGNPLAVFPDGARVEATAMQRIARELNLSETVFVLPPAKPDALARLRIFTPASELAFAGHPTIGTAFVLHTMGLIPGDAASFTFEEGVGPVGVRLEAGDTFLAWLTTPPVAFGPTLAESAGVAAALGLVAADLRSDAPVQLAGAGTPFLYVALRDKAAVDRASLDARGARGMLGDVTVAGVYVFALTGNGVYSRMFAPEQGIVEDPATGSATGPLAAYLLEQRLVAERDPLELIAEQGTRMGRRSILRLCVRGKGSQRTIEVGGSAVSLIEGTLEL